MTTPRGWNIDSKARRKRLFYPDQHECVHRRFETYLRDELQSDGRINGNVSADSESSKSGQDEEGAVRIRCSEADSKDGGYQDSKVEGPLSACNKLLARHPTDSATSQPTNDVCQHSPHKRACLVIRWYFGAGQRFVVPAVRPAENEVEIFPDWSSRRRESAVPNAVGIWMHLLPNPNSCCTGPSTSPKAFAHSKSRK